MTDNEEFRFLDLAKDIRLEMYDLFTAETRCYTVQTIRGRAIPRISVATKRIPCMGLLTTCRQIYHEVSSMLASRLDSEPLRICTNWEEMCIPTMNLLMVCIPAFVTVDDPVSRVERYHSSGQVGLQTPNLREVLLLHNAMPSGPKLEVEFTVELDDELLRPENLQSMKEAVQIFYRWLGEMNNNQLLISEGSPIDITIRPKPKTETSKKLLTRERLFDNEEFPKEFWLGKMWTCQVGECMTESEWQRNWEEGKHFGKLEQM
ncbi:hypothetical protein J4E91_009997 [Alternaria rosae]|nr:hypothetical protein J4E91_009997 [Alternaria rosae]